MTTEQYLEVSNAIEQLVPLSKATGLTCSLDEVEHDEETTLARFNGNEQFFGTFWVRLQWPARLAKKTAAAVKVTITWYYIQTWIVEPDGTVRQWRHYRRMWAE
jgi:hypothetical protein